MSCTGHISQKVDSKGQVTHIKTSDY